MSSSLGGINGGFPARLKTASTVSVDVTGPRGGGEISYRKSSEWSVMKGPVPVLFYSMCFLAASLILLFPEIEVSFASLTSRIIVTSLVFVGGVLLVLANDVVAWFNMLFFFHLGVESFVCKSLYDFANDDSTSSSDEIYAWVGFGIVIAHLLPFLLSDKESRLLTLCALAGLPVNAGAILWLADDHALNHVLQRSLIGLVTLSSSALLLVTLMVGCIPCVEQSVYTVLKKGFTTGQWITYAKYEYRC